MATGVVFFHRFYMCQSFAKFDRWVCIVPRHGMIKIADNIDRRLLQLRASYWLVK
jgi:hypothetical protein